MPREKEGFRDNLERLNEKFPDKELLSRCDVADFLGIHRTTVARWFNFSVHGYISKVTLARALC